MDILHYANARNSFISDYLKAAETKKRMKKSYAIIKFITNDGDMLYSVSKNIEMSGLMNTFYDDASWLVINHNNDKNFEDKIATIKTKFENKGCQVVVTLIRGT